MLMNLEVIVLITATVFLFYFATAEQELQYACSHCQTTKCLDDPPCQPKSLCRNVIAIPLTDSQKATLLQTHNELRSKVALGQQEGQPSAADMMEFIWNDQLANMAQCFANECEFDHFSCSLANRGQFGQNIYGVWYAPNPPTDLDYEEPVNGWFEENEIFPKKYVDNFIFEDDNGYGHYSQLIWGNTTEVGCAAVLFQDVDDWWAHQIYCNYFPSGNYEFRPVYQSGIPASKCPHGKSRHYRGLCRPLA